jgi:hypothetical protein
VHAAFRESLLTRGAPIRVCAEAARSAAMTAPAFHSP